MDVYLPHTHIYMLLLISVIVIWKDFYCSQVLKNYILEASIPLSYCRLESIMLQNFAHYAFWHFPNFLPIMLSRFALCWHFIFIIAYFCIKRIKIGIKCELLEQLQYKHLIKKGSILTKEILLIMLFGISPIFCLLCSLLCFQGLHYQDLGLCTRCLATCYLEVHTSQPLISCLL